MPQPRRFRPDDVVAFTDPTTGSGEVRIWEDGLGQDGGPFVLLVELARLMLVGAEPATLWLVGIWAGALMGATRRAPAPECRAGRWSSWR